MEYHIVPHEETTTKSEVDKIAISFRPARAPYFSTRRAALGSRSTTGLSKLYLLDGGGIDAFCSANWMPCMLILRSAS